MLRVVAAFVIIATLSAAAGNKVLASGQASSELLDCAQKALGGPAIHTLKSFTVNGRLMRTELSGREQVYELEIRSLVPSHYLRTERWKLPRGTVTYSYGFSGERLLNDVRADGPDMEFGGSWGPDQLATEKRNAALMLMALVALPIGPVRIQPAAAAPVQHSFVGVIGDRTVIFHLAADCTPTQMTYDASVRVPEPGKQFAVPPPPKPVTVHVSLEKRRSVAGLLIPHSIVKRVGSVILERIDINLFRANPPLTPGDFVKK